MAIEAVEEHPVTKVLDFSYGCQQGGLLTQNLSVYKNINAMK